VGATYRKIPGLLRKGGLHTVCEEALCPNQGECFSRGTATFLILGDRCTRNCRFCSVAHGPSGPPDPEEPVRVAEAVQEMGLRYVVITSVTRDDLGDGGAGLFAQTIEEIRRRAPGTLVELLIPDFLGDADALHTVLEAHPDVLNHNLETVPRLYPSVRPGAVYRRSQELLERAKRFEPTIPTKSGLMLGLGESPEEIDQTLRDLRRMGCDILTLGQYLQPSGKHLPVHRFVHPGEFEEWRKIGLELGFAEVASGPLVRSSYRAEAFYLAATSSRETP
jgi:lipoic acid synthetase